MNQGRKQSCGNSQCVSWACRPGACMCIHKAQSKELDRKMAAGMPGSSPQIPLPTSVGSFQNRGP